MTSLTVSGHFVLNGALLNQEEACISIFNQALFHGFGVYESIAVESGRCFHLEDHVGRLFQSARMIELPIPYEHSAIQGWVENLLEVDRISESLLRIIVVGPNGDEDTLIYILPTPLPRYPRTLFMSGARAITFEGCRPLPQAKTLNTLVNYLALRRARQAGVHEAFLVNTENCLTEGSRSNLFVVAGGKLITPPARQVLSGITREIVWKLAELRGIAVIEQPIRKADLASVEEMFVTSTSMHVIPIVQVDDQHIGRGQVGPITRTLMWDFESYYTKVMSRDVTPVLLGS